MLSHDTPVFCDNGDGGCNCSDDYSHGDSACYAHAHDNNHANGASAASADGVHHDEEAAVVGAAD